EAIAKIGINGKDIAGIGITNQRETTIVWDAETGEPVYNAIVWQDRRTSAFCDELKARGLVDKIREKTGLIIDAYFSGTKIKWILDNVPGAREKAEAGKLRFGTVDCWLVWQLTRGTVHVTDVSNASRTMLFNINTLEWDAELLDLLGIPVSMMPSVRSSSEVYGYTKTTIFAHEVPIAGIAGDQQAALFGQMCTVPGSVKNTYGTGCFLLMNTGEKPILSRNNLLTTVAWKIGDTVNYALEGSIFVGGSVVQWLRDGLGIIRSSSEIEALAASVPDSDGVYFVPALTGMGAPYWDQYAHGLICGITRGTTAAHIARAALDGIAFQTMDIVAAMERDAGVKLAELKVDGGASRNNLMMQFQADILGTAVIRPEVTETTAMGACYLAGLAVGYWGSLDEIRKQWKAERTFTPSGADVTAAKEGWKDAISRTINH
ncbi:MAG: glycerol kinase GlpK, partial [Bacteroidales bacterium]|nr:glycerol kinase GlpK [Bacteroidales bacterium]